MKIQRLNYKKCLRTLPFASKILKNFKSLKNTMSISFSFGLKPLKFYFKNTLKLSRILKTPLNFKKFQKHPRHWYYE